MIAPKIEFLPKKRLVGKSTIMSLTDNKTRALWQSFMADRAKIKNAIGNELYSIQVYDGLDYFQDFNPKKEFTKWACIETDAENIPNGLEAFELPEGQYAVFLHHGPSSLFPKTAQFIFKQWLPNSEYVLDDRPHFEVLGEKYRNHHPDSEEEVWIPIK